MFIGQLNGMKMEMADIGNAYLEARTNEQVCCWAGPEFAHVGMKGQMLVISKSLYGLKSSGARFHDLFADHMHDMGFFPCKDDPDVWMRDCTTHWEYVATWVDDLMYIGHHPDQYFGQLREIGFKLKGVGEPEHHLGGDFKYVDTTEHVFTWGSTTFVKKMIQKYEVMFGETVPKREVHSPLEPGDHPELDLTELCDGQEINKYQSMIGDMQWAVSMGRIDIYCATMTLGGYRAAPRKGHLERSKRIYSYL